MLTTFVNLTDLIKPIFNEMTTINMIVMKTDNPSYNNKSEELLISPLQTISLGTTFTKTKM